MRAIGVYTLAAAMAALALPAEAQVYRAPGVLGRQPLPQAQQSDYPPTPPGCGLFGVGGVAYMHKDYRLAIQQMTPVAQTGAMCPNMFIGLSEQALNQPAAAIPYFKRAAEAGLPAAAMALADAYERGAGVSRDMAQAQAWRQKADTISPGNPSPPVQTAAAQTPLVGQTAKPTCEAQRNAVNGDAWTAFFAEQRAHTDPVVQAKVQAAADAGDAWAQFQYATSYIRQSNGDLFVDYLERSADQHDCAADKALVYYFYSIGQANDGHHDAAAGDAYRQTKIYADKSAADGLPMAPEFTKVINDKVAAADARDQAVIDAERAKNDATVLAAAEQARQKQMAEAKLAAAKKNYQAIAAQARNEKNNGDRPGRYSSLLQIWNETDRNAAVSQATGFGGLASALDFESELGGVADIRYINSYKDQDSYDVVVIITPLNEHPFTTALKDSPAAQIERGGEPEGRRQTFTFVRGDDGWILPPQDRAF